MQNTIPELESALESLLAAPNSPFRKEPLSALYTKVLARQAFHQDGEWKQLLQEAYGSSRLEQQQGHLREQITRLEALSPMNFSVGEWYQLLYALYGNYSVDAADNSLIVSGRKQVGRVVPNLQQFQMQLTSIKADTLPLLRDMLYFAALSRDKRISGITLEREFLNAHGVDHRVVQNSLIPAILAQQQPTGAERTARLSELARVLPHLDVDFEVLGIAQWAQRTEHAYLRLPLPTSGPVYGSTSVTPPAINKTQLRKNIASDLCEHNDLLLTVDPTKLEPATLERMHANATLHSRSLEPLSKDALRKLSAFIVHDTGLLAQAQLDERGLIVKARAEVSELAAQHEQLCKTADQPRLFASGQAAALRFEPPQVELLSKWSAHQMTHALGLHITTLKLYQLSSA